MVDARGRGRIVMLVDNGVHGDSRVQKTAQSAAEAGWDVTLLGRSPNGADQHWKLGLAEVRLVRTPALLAQPASTFRRPLLRPFAYPPTGVAARRRQEVRARRADLDVRRAALRIDATRASVPSIDSRILDLRTLANRARGKWVSFRTRQLDLTQQTRRRHGGLGARAVAATTRVVFGSRSWRRLTPQLWDYELAYGPVVDGLKPDIIHANDYRMLGVGARAKSRARAKGRDVKLVWDAHEYLPGFRPLDDVRWLPGNVAHEREYAPYADAVVTVSSALADLLAADHHLTERPQVVMNAPTSSDASDSDAARVGDVRSACGLDSDTPLLAYCGNVAPVRGVDLMVEALPRLPGVHIALVSIPPNKNIPKAISNVLVRARELGVEDRIHVLPYVDYHYVSRFLSTADAAASPLVHLPNHEIALSNKFFEYSQARLPMVVSDVRTMAETVRSTGQGEVFRAGDVDDYVRAVDALLADPKRYRAAYDQPGLLTRWTWEVQYQVMDQVYARLAPEIAAVDQMIVAAPTA